MATRSLVFDGGVPDWVIELLVDSIVDHIGPKVSRPVVSAAVKLALRAASEVNLETLRDVLGRLSTPASMARAIWPGFRNAAEDLICEVDCPESGDPHQLAEGDGTYICPDCHQEIRVSDGEAVHAMLAECPVAKEEFWVGPEDGPYSCPLSDLEVTVEDGEAAHDDVPEVRCPTSRVIIRLQDDGIYPCPDCGADIEVEDGVASHPRPARRSQRSIRRRSAAVSRKRRPTRK